MKNIVVVSGGFDPIHSGHIALMNRAKEMGDILVVGINSDKWLTRKKGNYFMDWLERSKIVSNLKPVDYVIKFNDDDGSAKDLLKIVRQTWKDDHIIFANGGDRTEVNNNEIDFKDDNLTFAYGVGGYDKLNSSSDILKRWEDNNDY